ncbi:MAG TPA: hypothetical protein VIQ30_05630 [Pseudonocardia sp.]
MIAPPLYIDLRTPAPRSRYGLLDAADPVVPEDPKFVNGIEFEPLCLMNASVDPADCGPSEEYEFTDGRTLNTAAPIHIYAGFKCRAPGLTSEVLRREADAAMTFSGPTALEAYLWTPPPAADPDPAAPQAMRLMSPDTVVLGGGTAVGLTKGLRLLEDYLTREYGRVGVIHAPAGVSTDAADRQQVRWESGRPVTTLGTRWSFGAYPYADPEGVAAAADTAWLVATGAVTLRQTPATVYSDYLQVLDRATNEVFALARKTYVVAWECVTAAVLVNLTT